MSRKKLALTFAAFGLIAFSGAARAKGTAEQIVDDLNRALAERTDLAPEAAAQARDLLAGGDRSAVAIARVVRILYPEFDRVSRDLAQGDPEALAALENFTRHDDPLLAAEAAYALGRARLGREDFESAAAHLSEVNTRLAGHSLRVGDSLYYQGISQAGALRYDEAVDSLLTFLGFFPDASSDLLADARGRVARLEQLGTGDLEDVARHMDYSGSKLAHADAGVATQQVQGRIIDMLDELIRIAEQPPS